MGLPFSLQGRALPWSNEAEDNLKSMAAMQCEQPQQRIQVIKPIVPCRTADWLQVEEHQSCEVPLVCRVMCHLAMHSAFFDPNVNAWCSANDCSGAVYLPWQKGHELTLTLASLQITVVQTCSSVNWNSDFPFVSLNVPQLSSTVSLSAIHQWYIRWTTQELPKIKPKHLDGPLLAGCSIDHKNLEMWWFFCHFSLFLSH